MRAILAALSLSFLAACAAGANVIVTTRENGAEERIPATVQKPEGSGPFPAVVIAHDCSGLGPASSGAPGRWANELVAHGYVVILPDSYVTRWYPAGVCTEASADRARIGFLQRARDALAALAYLRTLPYVDPARVGVMGGSAGGNTTLTVMLPPAAGRAQPGFAAGVALYPGCRARMGEWRGDMGGVYKPVAPVLILTGEADDWTPSEPCRKLAAAAEKAGYPVSIKVYPGTYHSFDSPNPQRYVQARVNPNSPTGRGATTAGNPEAWADSIREVLAFFARNLAPGR